MEWKHCTSQMGMAFSAGWSKTSLDNLANSKHIGSFIDKQLNVVGYLFKLGNDLMILPSTNVSQSGGIEAFLGKEHATELILCFKYSYLSTLRLLL